MNLKIRRLGAIFIDYLIIFYTCYYFLQILQPLAKKYIFLEIVFTLTALILFANLFLRKDMIFGYESIGKKIMRLKIYNESGMRIKNKKKLIDRVYYSLFFFYFPFYPYIILINNRSRGDRIVKTVVK